MAENKKVAPLLTTDIERNTIEDRFESAGETPFGELIQQIVQGPKKQSKMNRYLMREDGDKKLCIPITLPPHQLDSDVYYPTRRLRMTQSRFNDMDFVPAGGWVKENLKDEDGRNIMGADGKTIKAYFWCILSIENISESQECSFTDIEYTKGSDIIEFNRAKQVLGSMGGMTRQRVEDDSDVVEV